MPCFFIHLEIAGDVSTKIGETSKEKVNNTIHATKSTVVMQLSSSSKTVDTSDLGMGFVNNRSKLLDYLNLILGVEPLVSHNVATS